MLFAVDLDVTARILAEQDAIAGLHVERRSLPVLVLLARTDGEHLALLGLLLRRVGDDDSPGAPLLLVLESLDDQPVVQRSNLRCHGSCPSLKVALARASAAER